MSKPQSLADFLNVDDPRPAEAQEAAERVEGTLASVIDITEPTDFCERILASREFRQYILNGIVLGDLPAAVLTRVMDHGWGKPPERLEHTGKDGGPIEVREIRRVIVHPKKDAFAQLEASAVDAPRKVTH